MDSNELNLSELDYSVLHRIFAFVYECYGVEFVILDLSLVDRKMHYAYELEHDGLSRSWKEGIAVHSWLRWKDFIISDMSYLKINPIGDTEDPQWG